MQNAEAINIGRNIEEKPKTSYLTNGFTLKSWLLTKDHKRIAILSRYGFGIFCARRSLRFADSP